MSDKVTVWLRSGHRRVGLPFEVGEKQQQLLVRLEVTGDEDEVFSHDTTFVRVKKREKSAV
ncbi:MAG: hypothetical protein H0W90_08115 [Actinobacteria bacterium]|nr:hypothetical protein [Actinomycetota bacterium]